MRLRATHVVADALILFRRDRELLLGLAGPFWFLPAFALALLVPTAPGMPEGARAGTPEATAWVEALAQWVATQGHWFMLAAGIGGWGTATLYALYLDRSRPDLRAALRMGARLWPRFMLLSLLVGLMAVGGLALWILPGLYILGRFLPAGPALVAERPLGALNAVGRGFALTRGTGLPLMGVTAAISGLSWFAPQPLLSLDAWLRAQPGGANPLALATVDALAAAVTTLAALASALLAVAAYRRLTSSGT
ncbi:MAG: hypothetical protein JWN21_1392 [Sphingomonas bacterium]|uniref:hypothetical protein n=1 Tax=Sphingomonas bacterium TaxID=1895847 RepID=UPI00262A417F|nr:hypothetical protein [Sphingomonas bacterium]MDB5695849.1 hypothetical protein [Sphingomonas bacterium]